MQQVQRLHAGGAFVDGEDAGVAQVLLDRPVGDIAGPAEHLDRLAGGVEGGLAAEGLDDRQEPAGQGRGAGLGLGIGLQFGQVALDGGGVDQAAQHLDPAQALHQLTLHVGVAVERDRRLGRLAALAAVGGIGAGGFGRARRDSQPLDAHRQAHLGDHGEQLRQPPPLLADQPGPGALEADRTGRRAVQTHLLFQAADQDGVARPVVQHAWRQEQGQARPSGRGARRPRQDAVADARRQVVVGEGDPDLFPGDRPVAVIQGRGQGADAPDVGAGVCLRDDDGRGPLARR